MFADVFRGALRRDSAVALAFLFLVFTAATRAAPATAGSAASSAPSESDRIVPRDLAAMLKSAKGPRPLLLHVGFRVLYVQAHIPGSEYAGPAAKPEGLEQLRKRVESLPRAQSIVLYCGCCPWIKCPNITPAFQELRRMGFSDVKVLYVADNFGRDWVSRGYPTAKGE